MIQSDYLWGVDLGGTKIEGIVIHKESGDILARERVPTESIHGYKHIISQITKLIDQLKEITGLSPLRVGFSTPGALDPTTQKHKNSNTTCMNDQYLKKDIEKALGIPIELANDANCFALAEATMGMVKEVAPDSTVVFGVILGTGVGGGVVVNGKVINGRHGIGGEWGHNVFYEDGEDCYCGKKGCNEGVFAGPALERYYLKISGKSKKLKDIAQDAENGIDEFATQTIDHLLQCFGKAVSYIVNVLDPDVIVLGGGVSNIQRLYVDGPKELSKWIFNNKKVETLILPPKLGDSAGVFGAAELVR
ncbi:Sugar kinase of the NBD/HSP70 family, may contain an N-terminal HTH domain [Spirosomataceae bacterium TFI 002]|nr:Sugar kinase of the NBD/HSP70 family, may contain an N-terminal HTH domain [Spirosomataceae bacterium TFI 002]